MKFSTWNSAARNYDYYDAPGTQGIHVGAPPRVRGSDLGATPDQAAWRLPSNATRVGSGELPQGRIASLGDSSSITAPSMTTIAIVAAIGYFAWKAFR